MIQPCHASELHFISLELIHDCCVFFLLFRGGIRDSLHESNQEDV